MRILVENSFVLHQPWASAVVDGAFPVLLRNISTNARGFIGVCAARTPDTHYELEPKEDYRLGALVGAVEVLECKTLDEPPAEWLARQYGKTLAEFYPNHFLPTRRPYFAWLLGSALKSLKPMTVKGEIRLWRRGKHVITGRLTRMPVIRIAPKSEPAGRQVLASRH